jgi:hypothetical protein
MNSEKNGEKVAMSTAPVAPLISSNIGDQTFCFKDATSKALFPDFRVVKFVAYVGGTVIKPHDEYSITVGSKCTIAEIEKTLGCRYIGVDKLCEIEIPALLFPSQRHLEKIVYMLN